jgi:flavodoxin
MLSNQPKSAIVCFSRTGYSARLARKLEDKTGQLIVRLETSRYPGNTLGYLRAGFDSLGNAFELPDGFAEHISSFGDLVLCGPVWIGKPAAPLRSVLRTLGDTATRVSLFLTCREEVSGQKALAFGAHDLGRKLCAARCLPNKLEGTADEEHEINRFATLVSARPRGTLD